MAIEIRLPSILLTAFFCLLLLEHPALALSPCDPAFAPAKSDVEEFNIKGDLQWYDDPFYDDRESANTGSVEANYTRLVDKPDEDYGFRVEGSGHTQFNFKRVQEFRIWGNGNYKHFVSGDRFILGAGDLSVALDVPSGDGSGMEVPTDVDITAGGGLGRFRDVTPLAKAIRIQNYFLDQGVILGPFTDDKLKEIAQKLSDQDYTLAQRIQELEAAIEETGLTAEGNLGAKALLDLEAIIESQSEARLCGWEVQTSVGLSLNGFPPTSMRETFVLNWNFAFVPDPVTQWTGGLRFNTSLEFLSDYSVRATLTLTRRLSENLRARASMSFNRDPDKLKIGFVDRWQFTTSAFFQISNQISVTLSGEVIHETGYEEISRRLAVQFNYDIF